MKKKQLNELLNFAVSILIRSGRISRKYFRSNIKVASKSNHSFDPVTIADREVEAYIRRQIERQFPEHSIYGEEFGHKQGNEISWLIDPVDGTKGFISGSPMWGSLLGVKENDTPVIGIMHQPFVRETFFADNNNAWCKSAGKISKLETSATIEPSRAILYCTHPDMFSSKKDQKRFKRVESQVKNSRYGGDCYGYCLMAAGHIDLVIEGGLKPYDIVPLIPIIESAGGVVTDWNGNSPVNGGTVVAAANRKLHRKVLSMLDS